MEGFIEVNEISDFISYIRSVSYFNYSLVHVLATIED